MKIFSTTTALIFVTTYIFGQTTCSTFSDEQWKIGTQWNSTKVSPCHADVYYNCHGFVLSYFENGCQPSSPQPAPYDCPDVQGFKQGGAITSNGKILQVCNETQGNIVFYDIGSQQGTHSAVKAIFSGTPKYISKYGTDGPLVAHDIEGSFYHYTYSPTVLGHYAYVGMAGNPAITGLGSVTFSAPSISGASYAWSIQSGGENIYIESGANTNVISLKPLHSGVAVLQLVTTHQCSTPKTQTKTLNIDTQVCLEGTYSNGGLTKNLQSGNNVSVGSVSTTVTCPGATTFSWTRTSGSINYYNSGNFTSFTMPSGGSISFRIDAFNGALKIGTRNISFYNFGSFAVYPNPTSSEFAVDVVENENLDIKIISEETNTVQDAITYESGQMIDVSRWKKGKYFLHIFHNSSLVKTTSILVE